MNSNKFTMTIIIQRLCINSLIDIFIRIVVISLNMGLVKYKCLSLTYKKKK